MSNFVKKNLYEFIRCMPKVELHVHLEGTIKSATLFELVARNNIDLPIETALMLNEFFKFKNFKQFLKIYKLVTSCLKTADDYELISYQFGCECARQNICYAEVTFSMFTNCMSTDLSWREILDALNRGRKKVFNEFGVDWRWVFDILRDDPRSQEFILDVILNSKHSGVIALGLTGSENLFNSDIFIKTFELARENKISITIHAGEMAGPKSIWSAIKTLHAGRIGHGVTCIQDSELVNFLKTKQIPLEICLTSNICMGVFPDLKSHSFRKLWDAGLFLTINSDDPALFNTDLTREYKNLVDHFDFNISDLEKISINGVHASFLPDDQKQTLNELFKAEFGKLRKELNL